MNELLKALSSSVGKKLVMGITGLVLCAFLVVHLAGNLFLYVGEQAYNDYAHLLHKQEFLLSIAETALFLLFLAHIGLAVITTRENRVARPLGYERKKSKLQDRLSLLAPETWMFISGAVLLGFVLLHLADFTFEWRLKGGPGEQPYAKAVRILRDGLSGKVYVVGCVILGVHLGHGFESAFKSLGLSHPKYDTLIRWVGILFAVAMAAGFASFPVWAEFLIGLRIAD